MTTSTTNPFPGVPMPAGASKVYDWCDIGSGDAFRDFEGMRWVIGSDEYADDWLDVVILGSQSADGRVEGLRVKIAGHVTELGAPYTQALGRALLEAAAEVDRWATR